MVSNKVFFSILLQLCTSVGDPIRGLFIKKQKDQHVKEKLVPRKGREEELFSNAVQCHLKKSLIFMFFRTLQFLK